MVSRAQVTYTGTTVADAFLATGSPENPEGTDLTDLNFGGAGALVVAPANSGKGEFQTILKFNLSDATNLFGSTYGNHWTVTALSLELTGNFATNGAQPNNMVFPKIHPGNFVIEWLSNDDWLEGTGMPNLPTMDGVTYNSLPDLLSQPHAILSTNTYTPPGNNVHVVYQLPLDTNLVADIAAGGDVTFLLYAADDQVGYLFNSYFYGRGNQPLIHVTAGAPPPRIVSAIFTGTNFHLAATGAANTSYQIQAADVLGTTNWQTLARVMTDTNGGVAYDDTNAPATRRFYRLAQ
jgi:hypothetical protein